MVWYGKEGDVNRSNRMTIGFYVLESCENEGGQKHIFKETPKDVRREA
jgi:hypothetical protein